MTGLLKHKKTPVSRLLKRRRQRQQQQQHQQQQQQHQQQQRQKLTLKAPKSRTCQML
jgi:hypothetical protein